MLGIWVAALLLAASAPARAQSTVEECKARLGNIQSDLNAILAAGDIGGNKPAQTHASLSSKLLGASDKLDQGKYADAPRKLEDFQDAVIAMRDTAKPKLSAPDAGLLLDSADGPSPASCSCHRPGPDARSRVQSVTEALADAATFGSID